MTSRWVVRAIGALGVLFLGLAAGCTSSDDEPPPPQGLTVGELAGAWLSGCRPESDGSGAVTSRITAVAITGAGAMTFFEYHWKTDDCDDNPAMLAENVGTLSLPGGEVSTVFGTATKANLTATEQWITLFDPDLVGQFDAADAYGVLVWTQGTRTEVTGVGYDGNPDGGVLQTLLMRAGNTLFVGDEGSVGPDGYPTQVQPEVTRVPTSPVTQAALQGEWSGSCRADNRPEYLSQSALEWLAVAGDQFRLTMTFYDSTGAPAASCDTDTWATPMVRDVMVMTLGSVATTAEKLTEMGFGTAGQITLTAREVTALNPTAVTALNDANTGAGAWGQTGWVLNTMKVIAADVQFDGSTGGPTTQKLSMLLRGDRFYVRGGEDPTTMPVDADGYSLSVGVVPMLRNHPIATVADLAGNWFGPCENPEGWATGSLQDLGGATVLREVWYSGGGTCQGTPSPYDYPLIPTIVTGSLMTDRGTAYFLDLEDDGGGHICTLAMRLGDRLYGQNLWWPGTIGTPCAAPGDFPVAVGESFLSRETTPVLTAPLSTWRGPCRQETASPDWMDYFTFHGGAMSGVTLEYAEGSGCTGGVTYQGDFYGTLGFGATVSVAEGNATRVVLTAPAEVPPPATESMPQVFKWMGDRFWFGDDLGPTDNGYPTTLIPEHGMVRIY